MTEVHNPCSNLDSQDCCQQEGQTQLEQITQDKTKCSIQITQDDAKAVLNADPILQSVI